MPQNTQAAPLTVIQRKGRLLDITERVDPAHTALLVVDVQNDFCDEKGVFGQLGYDMTWMDPMVEKLHVLIDEARRLNVLTIFVRGFEDGKFLSVPMAETYNRRGFIDSMACKDTWGAGWYDKITPKDGPNEMNFFKHRFSAFADTSLDLYLRSNGIKTLIITGVVTSGCVESSARDAFSEGYYVVVPPDCVADAAEERHKASLHKLEQAFGDLVMSEEIMETWQKASTKVRHWERDWKAGQTLQDLPSQVAPKHSALILINLQHDFCNPDGKLGQKGEDLRAAQSALSAIRDLLAKARQVGVMVVHVGTERSNLTTSPTDLVDGKTGAPMVDCGATIQGKAFVEPTGPEGDEEVIFKHRVGAFSDTRLELLLRSNGIRTVIVAGIDISGAIDSTVRAARDKDFYAIIPRNGVASFETTRHLEAPTLETLQHYFADVVPSEKIIAVWQEQESPED